MAYMIIRGNNNPIPLQAHEALKIRDTLNVDREKRPESIEIDNMIVKVSDIKMVDTKDDEASESPQDDYWGDWVEERKKWNKQTPKEKASSHTGVFTSLFRSVYNREPSVEESSRAHAIRLEFFEANPQWTVEHHDIYPELMERLPKTFGYLGGKIKQRVNNEQHLAGEAKIGELVWG